MKKNYFITLLFLLVCTISFAQTTVFSESFETGNSGTASENCNDGGGDFFTRTDGSDIGSYYNVSGQDGTFFFAAMDTDGSPCTMSTQTLSFNDINVSGYSNLTFAILLAEDKDGTNIDWDGGDLFYVEVDYDNSGNYTKILQFATTSNSGTNVSDPMQDTDFDGIGDGTALTDTFTEFTAALNNANEIDIRIVFDGLAAGDEDIALDFVRVIDGFTATPSLSITSPTENTVFNPETTSVDVSLSVANFNVASGGTGDGYIQYSITGGTLQDKFDVNDISFTSLSSGNYAVNVELVDNSGNSLSPAVSETVNFSIASYTTVADLAALRAGTEGNYYELSGEVVLTYARSSRNQKFIQDNSAGILIDDSSNVIQTTYNTFDGISGLKGRLTSFNGLLQFNPTVDPGSANSTGNTIVPEVVTIDSFNSNYANYESELIKLEAVTFADAGGTFASGQNYNISNGSNTTNFRTNFSEADYIGEAIPNGTVDLVVFGSVYINPSDANDITPQVTAINLAGFTLGTQFNEIQGFAIYPNPVNENRFVISSNSTDQKEVSIYNVLGKNVFNTTISGTKSEVNIPSIAKGMYILKVVEANKTATSKLIIR